MKLIIAGGRDTFLLKKDYQFIDELLPDITEVIQGGATGIDNCGKQWAKNKELPVKTFRANWKEHGMAAGPLRNAEMAHYADAVVLFPGGKGTNSMRHEAKKAGIKIYDCR